MRVFHSVAPRKKLFPLFGAFMLLGALLLGGCGLPKNSTSPHPEEESPLVAVPVHPTTSIPCIPGKMRDEDHPTAVLRPLSPPTPTLEPIRGMGTGNPFSSTDIPGKELSLQELALEVNRPTLNKKKDLFTSRDLGVLGEVADSVQDFRHSLEDSALEGGNKALNALPFVYAEPDQARVDYSGGTVTIGISVPVERLRIGKPLTPEATSTPAQPQKKP